MTMTRSTHRFWYKSQSPQWQWQNVLSAQLMINRKEVLDLKGILVMATILLSHNIIRHFGFLVYSFQIGLEIYSPDIS